MSRLLFGTIKSLWRRPPCGGDRPLRGDRAGQYSIRINDRYRVCFVWEPGYADDVEITDYH